MLNLNMSLQRKNWVSIYMCYLVQIESSEVPFYYPHTCSATASVECLGVSGFISLSCHLDVGYIEILFHF